MSDAAAAAVSKSKPKTAGKLCTCCLRSELPDQKHVVRIFLRCQQLPMRINKHGQREIQA